MNIRVNVLIIIAVCISALLVGTYFFAFKNDTKNATVDPEKSAETKRKEAASFSDNVVSDAISPVTDMPAYGGALIDDSHIAYFNERSLKRASLGGGAEEVLIPSLPGKILEAVWSPDRKQVLTLLDSGTERRWNLLDLSTKTVTQLKSGISSPRWSNLSERIFYSYSDPTTQTSELDTAKPNGSEWETIANTRMRGAFLSVVPQSALVSFWSAPSAFEETSLFTVPASGGEPRLIFSGKFGADYLWSPDGTKLLISNTLSKGGGDVRLGTANQTGGEFRTLQVPTMISKAVWSKDGKTVYYALPLSLPENAVLPNDYFSRPIHTHDSFWKIDVTTGKTQRVVDPEVVEGSYDSSGLFLGPDEEYLYFTDRITEKIFRIRIEQ
ncbi:MAG: hypothetical protein HGB34_00360 [Candidatus Moranbacteria bacterium]|nr:hypothetical protein [Candidatus Moranbacteria bacterium]